MSPTLTIHECAEVLRANGISISEPKLCKALDQGKLPFGFAVLGAGEKGQYSGVISRHKLYVWLDDFLGAPAVRL